MLSRRRTLAGIAAAIGSAGYFGVGHAEETEEFPPRPPLGDAEGPALHAARAWLREALVRDIRAFALGEERRFLVDQTTRTLSLVHADGLRLDLRAQLLASFNPHNGTFRWAWSNSSVERDFARASNTVRRRPETIRFPSFSTPIFKAPFEDCHALAALAGRLSGFAGIYRAITADHLSVFLGYAPPAERDVARLWSAGRATAEDESEALRLVAAYDAAMLPFDAEYGALLPESDSISDIGSSHDAVVRKIEAHREVIDDIHRRKSEVHGQFWRRSDDFWRPALSWPSPHDLQKRSAFIAAPRRAGGVYVIRGHSSVAPDAFVLQRFAEGMRIVDIDLDWGSAVLLA